MGKQEKNLYKGGATNATSRLVEHVGSKNGSEVAELIELATLINKLGSEIKKLDIDISTTEDINDKNEKIAIYNKAIDELKKAHELQAQKTKKAWNHVLPLKMDYIKLGEEKGEEPTEENKDSKPPVEQEAEENLNAEDKMLLEELRAKSSSITKKTDLQYFIDKAGEDPVAFAETFGKELLEKLIDKVSIEKLKKGLTFARSIDEASELAVALDQIITKREKNEIGTETNTNVVQEVVQEKEPDVASQKSINEDEDKKQKMDELFKQFMESIKERKILEKRLAEIDKLLEEPDSQPEVEQNSNEKKVEEEQVEKPNNEEAIEPTYEKKLLFKASGINGFEVIDTKERSNGEQIFEVLVQSGGTKAFLGISDDAKTQKYIVADDNYKYYFRNGAAKEFNLTPEDRKNIYERKKRIAVKNYGELELVEGAWKIIKPVEVNIIDN